MSDMDYRDTWLRNLVREGKAACPECQRNRLEHCTTCGRADAGAMAGRPDEVSTPRELA